MGQVITLKRKPVAEKIKVTDVSFVKDGKGIGSKGSNRCFWHVKSTGNYSADCIAGRALAEEYLRHCQKQSLPLQWIVADMKEVRGLEVGFLIAVGNCAALGARALIEATGNLDALRYGR